MFNKLKEKLGSFFGKKNDELEKEKKKPEAVEEEKLKVSKEKKSELIKKIKNIETKKPQLKEIKTEKKDEVAELIKENTQEIEHAIEEIEEKIEEAEPKNLGILAKIRSKMQTTKLSQETFDEFFEELESTLLENNVALDVVDKIKDDMQKDLVNIEIKKSSIEYEIKKSLKDSIKEILIEPFDVLKKIREKEEPFVILFFGINGAGKTTTIAKFANFLKENNITSVIAAGDTFRAASIEQLKTHGENLGIKIISQDYGSDPAAVGFDAISYAKSHGIKTILIDTAGRMHTKSDLMREMDKIIRVTKPDLKIFVAESITGNDAIEQAKSFNESFEIDCSILTKADVDERGGTMISVGFTTKKPILFLGTGQGYNDLEKFSKDEIIANLGLD